jgi:hypothetical protein
MAVHAGMNLREALDAAKQLGCTIETVVGTGELTLSHPAWHRRVRLNSRKKTAPRILIGLLLRLIREIPPEPGDAPQARRKRPPKGLPVARPSRATRASPEPLRDGYLAGPPLLVRDLNLPLDSRNGGGIIDTSRAVGPTR